MKQDPIIKGEGAESAEEMECEPIEPHTENSF